MRRIQTLLTTSDTAQPASAHFWWAVRPLIALTRVSPAESCCRANLQLAQETEKEKGVKRP